MMRFLRVLAIIAGILLILGAALFLYIHSSSAKAHIARYIEEEALKKFGLKLQIGKLDYSFFPLVVTVNELKIFGGQKNDKTFLTATSMEVHIVSLFSDPFHARKIVVKSPSLFPEHLPRLAKSDQKGGTFILDEIQIDNGSAGYQQHEITKVQGRIVASSSEIKVDQLQAKYKDASISLRGKVTMEEKPKYVFQYEIDGDASTVRNFYKRFPDIHGALNTTGEFTGTGENYQVKGVLHAENLQTGTEEAFFLEGEYLVNPSNASESAHPAPLLDLNINFRNVPYSLVSASLPEIPALATELSGKLRYTGGADFWLSESTFQVDLSRANRKGVPLEGMLEGSLANGKLALTGTDLATGKTIADLSGEFTPDSLSARVKASVGSTRDLSVFAPELADIPGSYEVDANLKGPYRNVEISGTITGTSPDFSVDLNGSYWSGTRKIQAEGQGKVEASLLNEDISGPIEFSGTVTGSTSQPVLKANVQGTQLIAFDMNLGDVAADLESDGRTLHFTGALPEYSSTVVGEYQIARKEFHLQADLKNITSQQLQPLLPETLQKTSGNVTATLEASGKLPQWRNSKATLVLHEAKLEQNGIILEIEPNSSMNLENQEIYTNLNVKAAEGTAAIRGTLPLDKTRPMNLKASGETSLSILSLLTNVFVGTGTLKFDVAASGQMANPLLSGDISSRNLELAWPQQNLTLKDASFRTNFSGKSIQVEGNGLLQLSREDVTGTGQVVLNGRGEGTRIETWSGTAQFTTENLAIGENKLEPGSPVVVSLKNNVIELKPVNLRAGEMLDVNATGTWNLKSKALQSEIKTNADLSIVSKFYPGLRAAGDLRAQAVIHGTSDAPQFAGSIELDKGMMRLEGYPMVLEKVRLVAPLEKNGIRIETLTASMGGGDLQATGRILWDQKAENAADIQISAKNVAMNYPEDFRSFLSSDLTFQGGQERYLLSGKVNILRASYREDLDPGGRLVHTLLQQKKALLPEADSLSNRIRLKLDIETMRDALMDNNMGRLRASAKFNVAGTVSEPLLTGRAFIREGSYLEFEGNTYTVEEAALDYRGTEILNPRMQIRLRTDVEYDADGRSKQCDIVLSVTGNMEDPKVESPQSSSCGELDSTQLYSLLLTGTTDLQDASSFFFSQQFAAFLTGAVLSDFQRSISRGLGLQTFAIEPLLIASESDPGARLTLGKRLSRDLDLAYSLSLNESTDQLWLANYRIRNNFHLRVVDDQDTFTTSLRHRFQFGPGGRPGSRGRSGGGRGRNTIGNVQIENETELTDQKILERVGKPGERYDFWTAQEGIDEIKKDLQQMGYLFPLVEIEELRGNESTMDIRVRVTGQGKRKWIVSGTEVGNSKTSEYDRWWREGFSDTSVLVQMELDLLETMRGKGFFGASVATTTENPSGTIVYRIDVTPGPEWKEGRLVFINQNSIPSDEFQDRLRSLYITRNEMISEAIHRYRELSKKITALYAEQGFLAASSKRGEIKYDSQQGIVEIEIIMKEGARSSVSSLAVTDNQTLPDELLASLSLTPGNVYLPLKLNTDEKAVLQYYKSQGYWNARADAVVEPMSGSSDVIIRYDFESGTQARIHSVQIRGRKVTREGLIRKELKLKEGELITEELLSEAQDRLYAMRVFESISMHLEETDVPGLYDVIVDIVEDKKYEVVYGGRYDSEEDFEGEAQLVDQNFLGTAQSVFVYGRLNSRENRYQLGYGSPSIFGWNWNAFFLAERVNVTELDLVQTNFTFQQQNALPGLFELQSGYKYTRNKTTLEIPGDPVPQEFIIGISRLLATLYGDYRDNPINATRGFFVSTGLEYSPDFLGSSQTFLKSYSQFFYYRNFSRFTVATGVRLGLATTFEQVFLLTPERFFAGGGDTIRGFRFEEVGPRDEIFNEPLGGEAVLILNEEMRFPIYKWFQGVVFYDLGNVYNEIPDFSFSDLRHSTGFGLRLALPYGVLARFDLGFNLDPLEDEPRTVFHFGFGQAF